MIIAVNITSTQTKQLPEENDFIFETFTRIIAAHPEHNFIIILEETIQSFFSAYKNAITVLVSPVKKNVAQLYLRNNVKISSILNKYKPDVYVTYAADASLKTRTKQVIIVNDLLFIHQPKLFKKSILLFYKNLFPSCIKKAAKIITVSESCKKDIVQHYKTADDKISVAYSGFNKSFEPVSYDEKENIKLNFTEGNEYFIYTGEIALHKNLINLLKAFSAFKKRLKSNMQLVIAGKPGVGYEAFIETLRLFKFKKEVKLLTDAPLPDVIKLTAAAYAMVHAVMNESFAAAPLQAMKSGVPVITADELASHEICADAALYANAENFKEVAVKMMLLYKDENLRNELIEKGKKQSAKFNWNTTAEIVWENIKNFQDK